MKGALFREIWQNRLCKIVPGIVDTMAGAILRKLCSQIFLKSAQAQTVFLQHGC